jgi:hypothetical protein
MSEQVEKSIIINNYINGLYEFMKIHKIKHKTLTDGKIEIFYLSEYHLFNLGYHFGRFTELQIN